MLRNNYDNLYIISSVLEYRRNRSKMRKMVKKV